MDTGCAVEAINGGYWAMSAIRDSLVACIDAARKKADGPPPTKHGERGLVYIAGWRCNPLRDLSSGNSWETSPWMSGGAPITQADVRDETVLGLLLACIAAGVTVRVMVWMPTSSLPDPNHGRDHLFLADAIAKGNELAKTHLGTDLDLGVVCLDARVSGFAGSHHQKMCVIRCADATPPVAYAGGVDLAWTRRDAPMVPSQHPKGEVPTKFYSGDWQSGVSTAGSPGQAPQGIPWPADGWPFGDDPMPEWMWGVLSIPRPAADKRPDTDLALDVYGALRHKWHDQHLRLTGPVVATIEHQFRERWSDSGFFSVLDHKADFEWLATGAHAYFTAASAIVSSHPTDMDRNVAVLPDPLPVPPVTGGTSTVQLWRTIPYRPRGMNPRRFVRGEFTVMRGYVKAMTTAKNLIFICDQYFWSLPTARLLNRQLRNVPSLAVVVVLPPHADSGESFVKVAPSTHVARRSAIQALIAGIDVEKRVAVFNAWDPTQIVGGVDVANRGVYVHAKAHVYDGELLVCGSANINRRSLTGDTELALAVHDPTVATSHLHNLWTLLTGGEPWPTQKTTGLPYDPRSMGGETLVEAMRAAAHPNLIVDPHFLHPTAETLPLPRGTRSTATGGRFGTVYNQLMENCSMTNDVIEDPTSTLQEVSDRVEDPALFWFTPRATMQEKIAQLRAMPPRRIMP
jgi:phosphatidylserine/phosphatidylglycerophosphate/cardiolipin synthase-like enzyme